jgi:hypothetical protein
MAGGSVCKPSPHERTARRYHAELITGLGQFRAGCGPLVTGWHDTAEGAWRAYCQLVLDKAIEIGSRDAADGDKQWQEFLQMLADKASRNATYGRAAAP